MMIVPSAGWLLPRPCVTNISAHESVPALDVRGRAGPAIRSGISTLPCGPSGYVVRNVSARESRHFSARTYRRTRKRSSGQALRH
ncbi:MAG: hypothetical protein V1876_02400 [Candidatus Peregrinibacteria bacterium]